MPLVYLLIILDKLIFGTHYLAFPNLWTSPFVYCIYPKYWGTYYHVCSKIWMSILLTAMLAASSWRGFLTLVLQNQDRSCLCKQCRSRSVGFWRSQLIWICTVCHSVYEFMLTISIKKSYWLKIRSGRDILIYSSWQGLNILSVEEVLLSKLFCLQPENGTTLKETICCPIIWVKEDFF